MDKLSKAENALFKKLNSPHKIQDYLDNIPFNHEKKGITLYSPSLVMKEKKAHCIEGAIFAAAALMYHGKDALLLDLKTIGRPHDFDHVITLFKENGLWGAISKTNHAVLRYRDPVYNSVRELVMSYFHEYFLYNGRKTLRSYSAPFNLKKIKSDWVTRQDYLWDIEKKLDNSKHIKLVTPKIINSLRKASLLERKVGQIAEWK